FGSIIQRNGGQSTRSDRSDARKNGWWRAAQSASHSSLVSTFRDRRRRSKLKRSALFTKFHFARHCNQRDRGSGILSDRSRRLLGLWNALPGIEKRRKVGDRAAADRSAVAGNRSLAGPGAPARCESPIEDR